MGNCGANCGNTPANLVLQAANSPTNLLLHFKQYIPIYVYVYLKSKLFFTYKEEKWICTTSYIRLWEFNLNCSTNPAYREGQLKTMIFSFFLIVLLSLFLVPFYNAFTRFKRICIFLCTIVRKLRLQKHFDVWHSLTYCTSVILKWMLWKPLYGAMIVVVTLFQTHHTRLRVMYSFMGTRHFP